MNLAIIGYGQMGREIEKTAKERGHKITAIIDISDDLKKINLAGTDVAIEFSAPKSAVKNIKTLAEKGINTVVGTTGWYQDLEAIKKIIAKNNIGFLWSSNFSIGVNIYFKIVEAASKLINKAEEYDIWATELHHKFKADSPSGTAKTLEEILLKNIDRKTKIVEEKLDRKIKDSEIHFSSTRGGTSNFSHIIGFDSDADVIKLEHSARNRSGYVLGTVKAAEWLKGKKGIFSMEDFLADFLKK